MLVKPSKEALRQSQNCTKISDFLGEGNVKALPRRFIYLLMVALIAIIMLINGLYQSWPKVAYICSSSIIILLVSQILARLGGRLLKNDIETVPFVLNGIFEFYKREEQNKNHQSILLENLRLSDYAMKIYLIVWFVLFNVINPISWIVSWYTGEFIQFAPLFLPYTDPQTLFGYILNSILLYFLTLLVYILFMLADLFYIFTTLQCIPMTVIYCLKLKSFGENLIKFKAENLKKKSVRVQLKQHPKIQEPQPSSSKAVSNRRPKSVEIEEENEPEIELETVEQQLIVLIKEFGIYNEYIKTVCSIMEFTTFVAVLTNALSIAMAFVVTLYHSKAIGSLLILFLFTQVLMSCLIGTIVKHQKEKVINELYGFLWYELSKPKQKIFLQFLHLCQQSYEFSVPIVGRLDMELFTGVMNGAYSYIMFLNKFA